MYDQVMMVLYRLLSRSSQSPQTSSRDLDSFFGDTPRHILFISRPCLSMQTNCLEWVAKYNINLNCTRSPWLCVALVNRRTKAPLRKAKTTKKPDVRTKQPKKVQFISKLMWHLLWVIKLVISTVVTVITF